MTRARRSTWVRSRAMTKGLSTCSVPVSVPMACSRSSGWTTNPCPSGYIPVNASPRLARNAAVTDRSAPTVRSGVNPTLILLDRHVHTVRVPLRVLRHNARQRAHRRACRPDGHGDPHGRPVGSIHPGMVRHGEDQRQRLLGPQVRSQDLAIERLLEAIGGDEAKPPQPPGPGQFGGLVPPVHDEIGRPRHIRPGPTQGLHIAVPQGLAHALVADKRRIPHHEIRLRPLRPPRVDVALQRDLGAVVGDGLAGDRVGLDGPPVPAGDGPARPRR